MNINDSDDQLIESLILDIGSGSNYLFSYKGKGVNKENQRKFNLLNHLLDENIIEECSKLNALGDTGAMEIMVRLTRKGEGVFESIRR